MKIRILSLTDVIAGAKVKDPPIGADLEREFPVLSARLPFGLNFARRHAGVVELPSCPVRCSDKVRTLLERGSTAPPAEQPRVAKDAPCN